MGVALTGDTTRFAGPTRSSEYRWSTDPAARLLYAPDEHAFLSRMYVSGLREVATLRGPGSRATHYVDLLLARSRRSPGGALNDDPDRGSVDRRALNTGVGRREA